MFLVHFYCPANLLTLNFSKTEFLLIGLKKTTDQNNNSSLDTSHSAVLEILASSLTNILPSLTKSHLSPKPVIRFVNFAVSGLTSIRQLPTQ